MEVVEETFGANGHFLVIKGQRAKRPRPSPPSSLASTSSIGGTSSGGGGGEDRHIHGHGNDDRSSSPAAMSNTEEDEDMANCLILLAQGRSKNNEQGLNGQKSMETREGLYAVYECKTCNRSFPSFQALGGHAASHKKPKAAIKEEKKGLGGGHFNINNTNSDKLLLQADHHPMEGTNNNKSKVHECSICGSEFSSGQALGGHMRRHRNTIAPMAANEEFANDMKSRKLLGLDLNLPAPDEQSPLGFSAPALVDCHY